jgi:hypothetical protein
MIKIYDIETGYIHKWVILKISIIYNNYKIITLIILLKNRILANSKCS